MPELLRPPYQPFGDPLEVARQYYAARANACQKLKLLIWEVNLGRSPSRIRELRRSVDRVVESYVETGEQLRRAEGFAATQCDTCGGWGRVRGHDSPSDPCPDCDARGVGMDRRA